VRSAHRCETGGAFARDAASAREALASQSLTSLVPSETAVASTAGWAPRSARYGLESSRGAAEPCVELVWPGREVPCGAPAATDW
jgi:hypothetical protein